MDTTALGTTMAEFMEETERRFEDKPQAEIGHVMVIAEVKIPDDGPEGSSGIYFRSSDPRLWAQQGLLHYALNAATVLNDEDDDGEEA